MKKIAKIMIWGIVIVFLVIAVKAGLETLGQMMYPLRHSEYIEEYAKEYELDPVLVMAVIKAESNYIHDAHSGIARGLMQLTDETAKWVAEKMKMKDFQPDDVENPETNIKMGCFYLRYLMDYYSDTDLALAAYNGGMGNVDKWLKNEEYSKDGKTLDTIPFPETSGYVKKVHRYMDIYRKLYANKKGL